MSHASAPICRASITAPVLQTLLRKGRKLILATACVLLLSSGAAISAPAAARASKHRHPPGSIRLPKQRLKVAGGVLCGHVGGRWVSGRMVGAGYFLADAKQAQNAAALARRSKGHRKRGYLAGARFYARAAKRGRSLCGAVRVRATAAAARRAGSANATPPTVWSQPAGSLPAPGFTGPSIPVPPQFFGQHLMFYWGLTPAIPVHAMRLWDSDTTWCEMDHGTASNQYDFGQLNALLGQASRLNADVLYTFGGTPQWAASGSYPQPSVIDQCSSGATMAPADESYWTNFVTALVTAEKGRIHAYELWNEVDYSAFWTGGMAAMVRMSVDAAAIIHRIDPSALVLGPSITATTEGYTFLHDYLAQLPAGTIDAVAIHTYTSGVPEDALPAQMNAVRSSLPPTYAHTPIWSTEGGWGQNADFSSNPSDQRAFVARYDLQLLAQHVERSYWYAYSNGAWGTLQSGSWDSGTLTPAGVASGTIYDWLAGGTLAGCGSSDGNLWICDLTTSDGKHARIVWTVKSAVSYPTAGYATVKTLDGGSSPASGSVHAAAEPVMLAS